MAIIGQEKIWHHWQELGSERLPQTVLLVGPPHIGKQTLARAAAQEILAATIIPVQAVDGHLVSVESIRALEDVWRVRWEKPVVILVVDAQQLRSDSNTTLLKIMEEPPRNVYFWLLANSREVVLPTILSRATVFSLAPVSREELQAGLVARGATAELIAPAIALADGRPGVAIRYVDDPIFREWLAAEEARFRKIFARPFLSEVEEILKDLYGKKDDHQAARANLAEVLQWWLYWLRQQNPQHPALLQIAASIGWLAENVHPRVILERIVLALQGGGVSDLVL